MVHLAKLQTPDPVVGLSDIHQAMDAPGKLQDLVSAVMNHPCRHVEEPVPQMLQELLFVQPRQGPLLDPAHQVVGQHTDRQIGPVRVKLPAGEPIQREPIFGLPDEVFRRGCRCSGTSAVAASSRLVTMV